MAPAASFPLLNLPKELLLLVYEYVYPLGQDEITDILKAQPPSKALTFTCKQICSEASLIYRASFRHFWSSSNSALSVNYDGNYMECVRRDIISINKAGIGHVNHLQDRIAQIIRRRHYLLPHPQQWRLAYRFGRVDDVSSIQKVDLAGNSGWTDEDCLGQTWRREGLAGCMREAQLWRADDGSSLGSVGFGAYGPFVVGLAMLEVVQPKLWTLQ